MKRRITSLCGGGLLAATLVSSCIPQASPARFEEDNMTPPAAAIETLQETELGPAEPGQSTETPSPSALQTAPAASGETMPMIATTPVPTEEKNIMPPSPPIDISANPAVQRWIEQAKEDLARRLSVQTDQIELLEFKMVTWPDGSLGCPQPGMAYTQVQRDGYLIRLRFEGKSFDYHGGGNRSPFLCEKTAGDEGLLPPPGLGDD